MVSVLLESKHERTYDNTKISHRQFRLYACGLARLLWDSYSKSCKEAIEASELYAEDSTKSCEQTYLKILPWVNDVTGIAIAVCCPRIEEIISYIPYLEGNIRHFFPTFCGWQDTYPEHIFRMENDFQLIKIQGQIDYKKMVKYITFPWRLDKNVFNLAQVIYEEREFQDIPYLRDSLLDVGCEDEIILKHLSHTDHMRGCWVLDQILGKC